MSVDGRLFIWPKGRTVKVEAVQQVVLSLGLPYAVKPFWYQAGVSVGAERVLVLEDGFENSPIVDYIRPLKKEQVEEAVRWALGLAESRGARKYIETMKRIFGDELIERTGEGDEIGERGE